MLYFNSFPKVITTDYKNNLILLTNLMTRVEIIPSLLKNPLLFYSYDIKDSDRPDIIANKYYNDSNRFWMVLYSNQTMNPQWDLPLNSRQFGEYIVSKYANAAGNTSPLTYVSTTIYEYRKTITTYDSISMTTNDRTIVVDGPTANTTLTGTTTNTFSDGSYVTQTITIDPVSIYRYELEQNEAKRNINLVNAGYSSQLEKDFQTLMNQ